jgi:hypothetical protein
MMAVGSDDIGPFTAESVASGFESEVLDAFALE